jgi:DMSO/TMAO reductase YedYZ molybdopterin-dependent catalytic subunit
MITDLNRRLFLGRAGLAALPWRAGPGLNGKDEPRPAPRLLVRQQKPENLEFPFTTLDRFITSNKLFYVRNHFPIPLLDTKAWRLEVAGAVQRPLRLNLDEIRGLPSVTRTATLECAGNGRVFLSPRVKGVQWELGAVSNAEWTGAPLAAVLEKAGVQPDAVEVLLEGADRGEPGNDPKPPGGMAFARSLPLAKAQKPEVLLAWAMNGQELPAAHGFPLRAVVGGWYGMASVKWLTRLVVLRQPFLGYWQTVDYATWGRTAGEPTLQAITEMQVKASIARPAAGEVVPAGTDYRIHGAAWAGEQEVAEVSVSTDRGRTWEAASLLGKPVPFAWRLWEHTWRKPAAGKWTVMARATDSRGRTQPLERDPQRLSYVINHVLPTPVEVSAG